MDIQLTAILFQIVNFGVVVGALTVLLYKPVLKVFEERTRRIEEGQKAAAEAVQQRQAIDTLRKNSQEELEAQRLTLIAAAQQEAQGEKAKIIGAAHEEAQRQLESLKTEWAKQKQEMISNLEKSLSDAVVAVAERVINQKLSSSDQEKLVAQELDAVLKKI